MRRVVEWGGVVVDRVVVLDDVMVVSGVVVMDGVVVVLAAAVETPEEVGAEVVSAVGSTIMVAASLRGGDDGRVGIASVDVSCAHVAAGSERIP